MEPDSYKISMSAGLYPSGEATMTIQNVQQPRLEFFIDMLRHSQGLLEVEEAPELEGLVLEMQRADADTTIQIRYRVGCDTILRLAVEARPWDGGHFLWRVDSSRCNSDPAQYRMVSWVYERAARIYEIFETSRDSVIEGVPAVKVED